MKLSQMTAAPSSLEIAGKVWHFSPMSDRDYGEFERWAQDREIDIAKRNLAGLERGDRDALLKAAFDKASAITLDSKDALRLINTVEGAAMLAYLSLRRAHPTISYQDARALVSDARVLASFMDRIARLNSKYEMPVAQMIQSKKKRGDRPSIVRSFIVGLQKFTVGLLTKSQH